jgi:succinyl-diaminopimelate desuccinylase
MSLAVGDLRRYLDRDRLTATLEALVQAPSENPPGAEAEVALSVAATFEELELGTETHETEPGRPSVVGRWSGGDGPTLTYCSHIDVVPAGDHSLWDHPPYGAVVHEGRMFGRGTSDAKGPCAAAIEAVRIMKAAGARFDGTLELAFVADEESGGFKGAEPLVLSGKVKPDVAIVGEPTSLRVVRAQRGIAWLTLATKGVAAHGSAPERGVNAIAHIAEIVHRLEDTLPDIDHPLLGRPTINVGTIQGGAKVNIIPASASIEVDRRTVPGETYESMLATLERAVDLAREKYPDIQATIDVHSSGDPFEVPADALVVTEAVSAVEEVTGAPAQIVGFRGASDARFMADAGADVIVLGPGDIQVAHTAREYIDLDELERGALTYALLFMRMLGAR